jgi:titin
VPGNGRVTVSWIAPFSNGGHPVTNYEVIAYHHDVRLAINVFHSTKLTESITGLKNGSAYTFTVGARNASGWSRLSARSTAVTAGVPVAPAKPSAVPGKGRVTISWHAPNDNGFGVDEYRVTPYINGSPGAARVFKTARTRQVVGGLQNGKPYSFKVAAHNRNGWSDASVNSSIAVPGK